MNTIQFFLAQYDTVRMMVDEMVFAGLSDEQLRQVPQEGPIQTLTLP